MSSREDGERQEIVGFLGVGLDNKDGHKRLTRSEHFLLVGGSFETHERMQDTAIRFGEGLRKRGKARPGDHTGRSAGPVARVARIVRGSP